MSKLIDLAGQKFGRLNVIKFTGSDRYGTAEWLCKCDCGDSIVVRGTALRRGNTKSCGCLQKEGARTRFNKYFFIKNTLYGGKYDNMEYNEYTGQKEKNFYFDQFGDSYLEMHEDDKKI